MIWSKILLPLSHCSVILDLALLAPMGEILSLDHADGMVIPGLKHLPHRHDGVLLRHVFQDGVIVVNKVTATCNQ